LVARCQGQSVGALALLAQLAPGALASILCDAKLACGLLKRGLCGLEGERLLVALRLGFDLRLAGLSR
jgi:hypothetical protein